MNSFQDLISNRRSTRVFSDEKISAAEVEIIFKAALLSPSSKNHTPWYFVAVEDKNMLQKLSKCKISGKPIANCTLAIVVLADPFASDVWIEDASIASLLIQLQAEDLGLGTCWIQIRDRNTKFGTPSDEYVREILDIPLHLQVLSVIAIGRKKDDKRPKEKDLQWEKIHINKFSTHPATEDNTTFDCSK